MLAAPHAATNTGTCPGGTCCPPGAACDKEGAWRHAAQGLLAGAGLAQRRCNMPGAEQLGKAEALAAPSAVAS